MAEHFEDLFAELRADTMLQVRPPGVAQVRRTVRRRRTATAAFAGVLLLALGGTVALLGFPSWSPVPASRGPLTKAELDRLVGVADEAVTAGNPGPAVFAGRGPVAAVVTATQQSYLGEINLQIACAGTGAVTLLARGRPGSESGSTKPVEVARLVARCSASPSATGTTFVLRGFADLTVDLVDADSAQGRAAFAYRATSDTGEPAVRGGTNNPTSALRLPDPLPPNSGLGGGGEVDGRPFDFGWAPLDGDFRLAVACAGTGTLRIRVRQARSAADPGGTVVATRTIEASCQYPPRRQDFGLGAIRNRQVNLVLSYESPSPAPGDVAFQVLAR